MLALVSIVVSIARISRVRDFVGASQIIIGFVCNS
jgi:hypothetical protein